MGIKGLGKVIRQYAPTCIQECRDLRNKNFCVDICIMLYSTIINYYNYAQRNSIDISLKKDYLHVHGIYNKILNFIANDINSLWIFDGNPPNIKREVINKRNEIRKNAKKKITEFNDKTFNESTNITIEDFSITNKINNNINPDINNNNDINKINENDDTSKINYSNTNKVTEISEPTFNIGKFNKRTITITRTMKRDVQKLLELIGLPYLEAISESEMQCAAFSQKWNAMSEDWDTLVFGSKNIIKSVNFERGTYTKINLDNLLNKLKLTHEQFVELCILLGCDYCPKIKGIRFDIYDVYKQYKNVDAFINYLKSENEKSGNEIYVIPSDYMERFNSAKNFYINGEVIDPESPNLELVWKEPKYDELKEFLLNFQCDETIISNDIDYIKHKYQDYVNKKWTKTCYY